MRKALALAAAAVLAACQHVPYTHRRHLVLIASDQERALGLQAYQQALSEAKLSTDPEKTALVRRVGEKLAAVADQKDFKWEFNLIESEQINAFCLPGGKVAVYAGLLPVARDEAGLAVVMGHEIAHALARHGAERMSQGLLAQAGGVALDAALANKPAQTREMYGQAYGLGANVGVLLPFSRRQESEADRIGLILMAKAGYDPEAAVGFWERMSQASSGGGKPPELLSTHPSDDRRMREIRERIPEAKSRAGR